MKDDITFTVGFELDDKNEDKIFNSINKMKNLPSTISSNPQNVLNNFRKQFDAQQFQKYIFSSSSNTFLKGFFEKEVRNYFNSFNKFKGLPNPEWMYPTVAGSNPQDYVSKFRREYDAQEISFNKFKEQNRKRQEEERLKHYWDNDPEGEKNYKTFQLKSRMTEMKKLYRDAAQEEDYVDDNGNFHYGKKSAIKEYTKAEQELKSLKSQNTIHKEIVDKEKAQNREITAQPPKLLKVLSVLYLISKVLDGIKKLWNGLKGNALTTVANDNAEKGFFSANAFGSLNANVNTKRASILRGLQNMGKAAPFSIGDFDSAMKSFQDLRLKAMSGQGISDDQQVISMQRLSDRLGLGYNIQSLLTNPNVDLTQLLSDILDAIEKFMPNLNSLGDMDKNLVTNDILTVIGDRLADAVTAHANYNMRTGESETMMGQVTTKGKDALELYDFTKNAKKFSDELANATSSLTTFGKNLADFFEPAGTGIMKFVGNIVGKENNIFDMARFDNSYASDLYTGFIGEIKDSADIDSSKKGWKEYDSEITARLAKGIGSEDDLFYALTYNPNIPNLTESKVEATGQLAMLDHMYNMMGSDGTFQDVLANKNNLSETEIEFAKKLSQWYGNKKFKSLKQLRNKFMDDRYFFPANSVFGENQIGDFSIGDNPMEYFKKILPEEYYQEFLVSLFSKGSPLLSGKVNSASIIDDADGDGKKDKYYTLRIELPNNTHFDVPLTKFTDGMVQTVAIAANSNSN